MVADTRSDLALASTGLFGRYRFPEATCNLTYHSTQTAARLVNLNVKTHNQSMKNYFLLGAALVLLLGCATSPSQSTKSNQTQPKAKESAGFAKGNYRLEGHCQKMEALGQDKTSACLNFMGIVASDPNFPQFVFALQENGAWIFKALGLPDTSNDGVAVYPVLSLVDLGEKIALPNGGECRLKPQGSGQEVRCVIWKGKEREILREVIFASNGTWIFKREF
jgi:hypothetical protein